MNEERRRKALWVSLALAVALVLATLGSALTATAGSGGPYDQTWFTIGGGGGTSEGGGYRLDGTAGQPGPGELVGDGYRLVGGLWAGGFVPYRIYLPLVMRSKGIDEGPKP
jgi:hypothetical protein